LIEALRGVVVIAERRVELDAVVEQRSVRKSIAFSPPYMLSPNMIANSNGKRARASAIFAATSY
jgi:hypothetical protein